MKERIVYLLKTYGLTVLIFLVAKMVFMLCNHEAVPVLTVADVWQVVWHGLSLDLSTALYFLIVPFLLAVASRWWRLPRGVFCTYYGIVAVAFSLAFVADTSLYPFWHFKLDASCLPYLKTPTEAMASVSTGYLLWRLAAFLLVAVGIFRLYKAVKLPRHGGQGWSEPLLYLLCVPIVVIGIRGGVGESTTNIGQVYFSQQQFLNHAAVNPVFSFLSSIGKSGDYIVQYDYMTADECRLLTDGLYDTRSLQPDTLLSTQRPNIVIVVMESCGAQFTSLGGRDDITPRLNQLSREAVSFSQCYANSWRTDKGVVSILSGYPAFPITSIMKVPEKSRKLPSIAQSLAREGYDCSFLYGGDINFTNMRSYVMSSGYAHLRWKTDYPAEAQQSAQWGVRDDLMFQSLLEEIRAERSEHWMKTLLTLSSHEPWDVPTSQLADPVYNAFNYLDCSLGQFVDSLRQLPQWQNLLLVILPDHGYRYKGIDETTLLYNRIPLLWAGGAVRQPRQVQAICNQSDLAATLLGQLGISHADFTFSRDVLSQNYRRQLAFHTFVDGVTVIDSTGFAAYDLEARHLMAAEGPDTQRLLRQGQALLQLFSSDFIQK